VIGPRDEGKADAVTDEDIERAERAGVVFTGQRTDMPECYSAMDMFLTASWREGFPRAAMEASSMGLPVIATDIRGCRQVVDDGVTGVLVPVRDPAALALAVERLADDEGVRLTMGAAARAKAVAEFDQDLVIRRTLEAYGRLRRS